MSENAVSIEPIEEQAFKQVFRAEIKRIDFSIDIMKKSIEQQDYKFTSAIEKLEKNFDAKFDRIDQRFEKIDQRFEKIDQRFEKLEDKMDSSFKWLIGTYITLTGVLLAAFYAFSTYIKK